jgi:hypothetical protein
VRLYIRLMGDGEEEEVELFSQGYPIDVDGRMVRKSHVIRRKDGKDLELSVLAKVETWLEFGEKVAD